MNYITSAQNPAIKELRALKLKKYRDESGLFFIEGVRFVEEALKEGVEIKKVFLSESFLSEDSNEEFIKAFHEKNHNVHVLSNNIFKEVSDTENPQGVLVVVKARHCKLDDIIKDNAFIIILDSIQDPGNLGTIIRTADASGADGIILSRGCVDLYNPKVLRSTMGSIFHIPVCRNIDLADAIQRLKVAGISVYAAHLSGTSYYFELDLSAGCAFIIGNEANGISEDTANLADLPVKIPMPGRAESLNASVAAGVLMYEVVRQRHVKSRMSVI